MLRATPSSLPPLLPFSHLFHIIEQSSTSTEQSVLSAKGCPIFLRVVMATGEEVIFTCEEEGEEEGEWVCVCERCSRCVGEVVWRCGEYVGDSVWMCGE